MRNVNITKPVGRGCPNLPGDVKKVQALLNAHRAIPLRPLDEDGACGPATVAAIEEFQQRVMRLARPDGKVTPQGMTISHLSPVDLSKTPDVLVPYREGRGLYVYAASEDLFGTPRAIESVQNLARRVGALGADVGIGHLSREAGGKHPKHASHQRGIDVDIRPIRKDRKHTGVRITDSQYDHEMTKTMVDYLFEDANVSLILFNDTRIKGVRRADHHDDHLHVRFKA